MPQAATKGSADRRVVPEPRPARPCPGSRRSGTRPAERGAGRRRHGQPGESALRVNSAQSAAPSRPARPPVTSPGDPREGPKDGSPHRPSHSPEPRRRAARLQAASGGQVTHSLRADGRPSPPLRSAPLRHRRLRLPALKPRPASGSAPGPAPELKPCRAPDHGRVWSHAPFQATPSTCNILSISPRASSV